MTVPTQIAGSCAEGMPPSTTLNRIDATRLMVGHITSTVQHDRATPCTRAPSLAGSTMRRARAAPPRVPHRLENSSTNSHMYDASASAARNTPFVRFENPPGMVGMPIFHATL